jgi:UPF0755 protein
MLRFLFLLLVLFMTTFSAGAYWLYKYHLTAPMTLYEDLHYRVEPNSTLSEVAKNLMEDEIMDYPTALAWLTLARFQKRAHLIKAGEYLIPVGTTPQQFLDILIAGKAIQHTLTIPEGWNFRQMMTAIRQHPRLVHTLKVADNTAIMKTLGKPEQHPEGRFFPDTYHFPSRTTDVEFLQRAYHQMEIELETAWQKRQENLPITTPEEALILASIIEKETGVTEERPLIAKVFINRLKKNMLLQTDPTIIYGLGESFDGNLRTRDLKDKDNSYNTYVHEGLPPTPIALPGRASLLAAVNPVKSDALYFVAKGDGSHYFSRTYQEHKCAIIEYQLKGKSPRRYRSYCRKNPRCAACRN